jgi:large subunit ribosomal protein L10
MKTATKIRKAFRDSRDASIGRLKVILQENSLFILVGYKSLDTFAVDSLRRLLRTQGAVLRIVKNSVMKIASSELTKGGLDSSFKGSTVAVIFSSEKDPVNLSKAVCDFANSEDRLQILGGIIETRSFDSKGIAKIAAMSSMDQLYADLLGVLISPARSLINILNSPMGHVVRMLKSYSEFVQKRD